MAPPPGLRQALFCTDRGAENPPASFVGRSVPRYYFNIRLDESETTDLVGRECPNDVAALSEALKEAGQLVRNQLFFNKVEDGWVEVEDENQREILRLPLRAAAY